MARSQPAMSLKPLSKQQQLALRLLLDGHSKKEIREKLSISQPTMYRWMQMPAWHDSLESAVREEQKTGEMQMRTLIPLATQVTHRLLLTGSDQVKLGAARLTFDTVARMTEREEQVEIMNELEARLSELQEVARNQGLMARPTAASDVVIEAESA